MRTQFFLYLGLGLSAILLGWFVWLVLKAFYSIFADLRTDRELSQLAMELAEKRRQGRLAAQARLNNGCQHEFDDALGALPPDVCRKCGIGRDPPEGDCDHSWQLLPGIIPESRCTKCGARFSSIPVTN
jgi:hypothetical protein